MEIVGESMRNELKFEGNVRDERGSEAKEKKNMKLPRKIKLHKRLKRVNDV